jgi:hypothetical protein
VKECEGLSRKKENLKKEEKKKLLSRVGGGMDQNTV